MPTALPENAANGAGASGNDVFIEPVEVVLILKHSHHARQLLAKHGRNVRTLEEQEPSREHTRTGEIDGRTVEGVHNERGRAVELTGQFAQHVVRLRYVDSAAEPVAEYHGAHGEPANNY